MTQFTLIFTTRHRGEYAVEKDCNLICDCINDYTKEYKYIYNGKELIVFHVYGVNKKARVDILTLIFERLQLLSYYQSLDLQSYTIK